MNEIRVGWAEADITPDGLVTLSGQYYHRASNGIHSRLKAVVLAMTSGSGESAVMVSMDVVAVPAYFQQRVRKRVQELEPEIDVQKIFLNATHTHSAPALSAIRIWWLTPDPDCLDPDEYGDMACEKIAQAVTEAWQKRCPGGVCRAQAVAAVGHCRRSVYADAHAEMYGSTSRSDFTGMEGNEDSTIELLVTVDADQSPSGVILNVSCPSQVMEATYAVSSDYMGRVRDLLKESFGPEFSTLCQIGAAGCQSPRDLVRMKDDTFWSARGVEILAQRIANAVREPIQSACTQADPSPAFGHSVQTLSLPVRLATEEEYNQATRELDELEKKLPREKALAQFCEQVHTNEKEPGRPGPYDSKLHDFVLMQNAEAVIKRYEDQKASTTFDIEHHVLRIGEVALVSCPFELFLDYGHRIKAISPAAQVFIVQLACDHAGYLPTQRAEELGGYGALIINGDVGSEGGAELVRQSIDCIRNFF